MPDHYYSPAPQSAHKPAQVAFSYRGHSLSFLTDSGVFSRLELDKGTELLLSALPEKLSGQVLDLGCGYGAIGIAVGKAYPDCSVTLADINHRAVDLAQVNAQANGVRAAVLQSDGYASFPEKQAWHFILQNPPIRAGKQVIYGMFSQGSRHLREGGSLWLVIRKQQGASSAMAYLKTLFEDVQAIEKKGGYWILRCASPQPAPEGENTHAL